jgi:Flp pilus assembly protein CpaB
MRTLLALLLMTSAGPSLAAEPTTPVIVAASDLPAGSVITLEVVSQRSLPSEHVTRSMVTPRSASSIVGRRTRLPLLAGEPLLSTFFDSAQQVDACRAFHRDDQAEVQVARHRQTLRTRRPPAPK